jgi:multidrug efflux pump subunit AcrB
MAGRTRGEIVGFAAGGVALAALAGFGLWLLADRIAAGETRDQDVLLTVEFKAGLRELSERGVPRIENALGAAEGLEFMISLSQADRIDLILKFRPGAKRDDVLAALRKRASELGPDLPSPLGAPAIAAAEPNGPTVAYVALVTDRTRFGPMDLTRIAEQHVKPRLQEVVGVAAVEMIGASGEQLRFTLDTHKLAAYGISVDAFETAMRQHGIELRKVPRQGAIAYSVDAWRLSVKPQDLANIVVQGRDGQAIRVGDIATIEFRLRDDAVVARFDRQAAVILEVRKRAEAGAAEVARGVRDRLAAIAQALPAGIDHKVGYACARCAGLPAR